MNNDERTHRYAMIGVTAYIEERIKMFHKEKNRLPGIIILGSLEWVQIMGCKLDEECRGYLQFMETSGVIDPATREVVIDRLMALEVDEIALDQLKWVMLLVLFNQPGQEYAYHMLEDMVFDEMQGHLH